PGHTDRVTTVAFSPDGRWIATAAWDGTARLWDAQTGKEMQRLNVPPTKWSPSPHLSRIMFSPDGEFVVVAHQAAPLEGGVIVWKRRTGEKVHEFPAGHGCVDISPDGRLIACGGWSEGLGIISLYEWPTGKLVRHLSGHQTRIDWLTFSPDGKTVFAQVGIPQPALGGIERGGLGGAKVRAWD